MVFTSSFSQVFPNKVEHHARDADSLSMVIKNKSGCSSLYPFQLVYVSLLELVSS